MFISLGPSCHAAGNLAKLGLRDQSLPFDWLLCNGTRVFEYVNKLINTHFRYFTKELIYNYRENVISKNYDYVEFVHYDLIKNKPIGRKKDRDKNLIEMMNRRADRFMNIISNKSNNVIFICRITYTLLIKDGLINNMKLYQDMLSFDTNKNIQCNFKILIYLCQIDNYEMILPTELLNLKHFIFDKYIHNTSFDKIYGNPKDFKYLLEKNKLYEKEILLLRIKNKR